MMAMRSEAWFYAVGAMAALAWKFSQYVYVGMRRQGRPFKDCALNWFELVTVDAKVSWLVTGSFVWVTGVLFVKQVGLSWLGGGLLLGIPVLNCTAFMLGVLMEYAAPSLAKWLWGKLPSSEKDGAA